jgi:classical protein kinase C
MNNKDDVFSNVHRKIDREKALIIAANAMRQSTSNPAVLSRLDAQIRDGRRNIEYFEGTLRDLEMQRMGSDVENLSLQQGGGGLAPGQGPPGSAQRSGRNPLTPPPKPGWNSHVGPDNGGYGDPGPGGYSQQLGGGHGLMPPRAPYAPGPHGGQKQKPNYSRLGKYLLNLQSIKLIVLARPDQI